MNLCDDSEQAQCSDGKEVDMDLISALQSVSVSVNVSLHFIDNDVATSSSDTVEVLIEEVKQKSSTS